MTLHGKGSEGAPPKTAPQRRCGGRRRVREGSRASPPRTSSNGGTTALDGRRDGRGRPRPRAPRERAVARPSSTSHDVAASSPSPSPSPNSDVRSSLPREEAFGRRPPGERCSAASDQKDRGRTQTVLPRLEVFRRRSLEKKCSGGAPTKKKCSGGAPLKRSVRRGAHLKRSVRQRPVERIEGELERRSLKKKSSGSDPSKRSVQRGDPSKRSVRRCPVRRFEGACPDKRKLSGALRQKDAGPARLKLTLPPPCTGPVTMHVGAAAATASRVVTQALALPPPLHPALSERGSSASVAEQRSSNSDSPANTAERQTPDSSRATALATARRALSPAQLQPRASQSGSTARRHHQNATREGVMVARSRCNRVPLCPRQLPSQPPSEQPRPRARVVASRAPPASNAEARKDRSSPWRGRRRQPTAVAPTGAVRRREASSRLGVCVLSQLTY